ncbi:MAG: hypothetical protein K0R38_4659 [Polyangiaceae bacterium]|nr:hypothetical protein [Polyangiaceae bacterium]
MGGGGWVAVGQWEVKNLTMATLVLFYGEEYVEPSNLGADLLCGPINDGIGSHIPGHAGYQLVSELAEELDFDLPEVSACSGGGGEGKICQ